MSAFPRLLLPHCARLGTLSRHISPLARSCCPQWVAPARGRATVGLAQSKNTLSDISEDMKDFFIDVQKTLKAEDSELFELTSYHLDGSGKAFRPRLIMHMAKALNFDVHHDRTLGAKQREVAVIAEMIHTASLMHDDIIDNADTRRGKRSAACRFGAVRATLSGDYVMAQAAVALAGLGHEEVVIILSQVLEDLVRGEYMQLGTKEDSAARFSHYLEKCYLKTASLMANSCKAVAVLGGCSAEMVQHSYNYGKYVGIAFQLIDDMLDYVATESQMGKPTAADLKLGLATAPILLAAQEYPDLNALIMRRFSSRGDVERAISLVSQSSGLEHTQRLALQYAKEATQVCKRLKSSPDSLSLENIASIVVSRCN